MPYTLRLLTIAAIAVPITALADNSVTLSGIVNIEYTAIKIDQSTASGGGGLDANNRFQKSIGDPTFFSRMGLTIRERAWRWPRRYRQDRICLCAWRGGERCRARAMGRPRFQALGHAAVW